MGIYKEAVMLKARWNYRGVLSVEDLQDLAVEDLDEIYMNLNKGLKDMKQESLLTSTTKNTDIIELKIAIIKDIVTEKLALANKVRDDRLKAEKRQRIMAIMAAKEDEDLKGKDIAELKELLENL